VSFFSEVHKKRTPPTVKAKTTALDKFPTASQIPQHTPIFIVCYMRLYLRLI